MQDLRRKIKAKKNCLKMDLGWTWTQFGKALGRSGTPLGLFWLLFGRFMAVKIEFFESIGPRWPPRSLWDRFGVDFGRIWAGFWEGLVRV